MKIAYIGNFEPEFSTENDVRKAVESLKIECICIQENKTSPKEILDMLDDIDLLLITTTWDDAIPLDEWIGIIKECSIKEIPTATLHLDTFWGKSRGERKWWLSPMFHTAYIFTADGDYQQNWKLLGKNHYWLPPAVRHTAVKKGKSRDDYTCDVAFVGSNGIGYHEDVWGYRKELLNNLREICKKRGWTFKNPGGDQPKINRDNDMNDFYASAKVVVGDSLCLKKEGSMYWSDRVPETTGRGGFLVMPKINELERFWNIPTYDWEDWDDLEKTIEYYIKKNQVRKQIVNFNMEQTKKYHTYVNRVETILKITGLWNRYEQEK